MGSPSPVPLKLCCPPGDPSQLQGEPDSITRRFRRTFALRSTPWIICIDSGLNIVRAGKDLIDTGIKVISSLNLKFTTVEFRVTLPKHHAGIGAVERIILFKTNPSTLSITLCSQSPQTFQEEESRHLWCFHHIPERSGRTLHHSRQTPQPAISVHVSGESWISGADPRSGWGWSSQNLSSRHWNPARRGSGRMCRLKFLHAQVV